MRQRLPKFVETGSCFDTTDIDRVKVRIPKKRERTPHLCFYGIENYSNDYVYCNVEFQLE